MSDAKRVAALWALVLAVFACFNAVYWPVAWRQRDLDPANFMPYAKKLHGEGQLAAAIDIVKQGIDANHPPYAAPYETLQAWLTEFHDADGATTLRPTIAFYRARATAPAEREQALREAIREFDLFNRMPRLLPETARAVDLAVKDLCPVLGVPDLAQNLKASDQYSLLALSGGTMVTNGKIGETGTKIDFDLIVQSGGAAKERRIAHIFLRGRDFGGQERGLHAALIDPANGQFLQGGIFDIWSSSAEADRLALLLRDAPEGTIGAFAVMDDASANMTETLEAGLRSFGLFPEAMVMRHLRFFGLRYSFAAIGVKGAIPGSALQAWSPEEFDGHRGHPVACAVFRAQAAKGSQP